MTSKNTDSSQGDGGKLPPSPGATAGPGQPEHTNSRAGNKVYKSGPLFLSSRGIGWTSWKKRWFILTRTSLVFFRNDPSAIPPKGSEVNLTLGGIDLNSSGSVVVKADKKLLTVLFPDGRDGRAFTLKAETSEDLFEWKTALEEALADAPSAATGQNGILRNDQPDAADAPLEQSKDRQPAKSLVIGRPILLVLEDIDGTPSFLEKALRFLEEHGVKVEGILRQAADVDDVEHRIRQFEQGKNEFSSNEDAHVIADCIKYILRELPSSPVPASCCNALLEAFRTDRNKRVSAMRGAICETFPEPNRRLLQRILMMMQTVVSHKAENRMSTSAVAACMAPLLLRPLLAGDCELGNDFDMDGDGSMQLLQAAAAANHAQAIVITLLEEYDSFFGEGSMSSELYSNSEESGSESEELSDDGSYEDDGEDDATEGSDTDLDDDIEHSSSGSCTETGESWDNDLNDNKMQGSKSPYDIEPNLTLSSSTPQNSIHQHNIEESEHILNQSNSSSTTQVNAIGEPVSEVLAKSSPEHDLTDKSAPTGVLKTATVSNGAGRGIRQSAFWERTPGKTNLSMESIDIGNVDEFEIDRLEVTKTDLQSRIAEEAKGNAILQEILEKHKNALIERRLALEQDVARLQEQLHKERELRLALEAGFKMCQDTIPVSFSIDGKIKADLEDIALVEADVINLKQTADDLTLQLNQQREQNSDLMCDPNNLPEKSSNHQEKLNDKQKDLEATSTKRTFGKSTRKKGQLNKADAEKDAKREPASLTKNHVPQNQQSNPVQNSKYAATPPTSSSAESVTGKRCTVPSKSQGNNRTEGATATSSALSKLTNRLNFLKERRTQIASEIQNFEKVQTPGQPFQNSESYSSERGTGSDQFVQNSDKGAATEGSSVQNIDRGRTSDGLAVPNLERGKSESFPNVDKGLTTPITLTR